MLACEGSGSSRELGGRWPLLGTHFRPFLLRRSLRGLGGTKSSSSEPGRAVIDEEGWGRRGDGGAEVFWWKIHVTGRYFKKL